MAGSTPTGGAQKWDGPKELDCCNVMPIYKILDSNKSSQLGVNTTRVTHSASSSTSSSSMRSNETNSPTLMKKSTSMPLYIGLYGAASNQTTKTEESIIEREIRLQLEKEAEIKSLHSQGHSSANPSLERSNLGYPQVPSPQSSNSNFPAQSSNQKTSPRLSPSGATLDNGNRGELNQQFSGLHVDQTHNGRTHGSSDSTISLGAPVLDLSPNNNSYSGDELDSSSTNEQRRTQTYHDKTRLVRKVQPFEDSERDLESKMSYMKPQTETVIEREVRLTRQREGSLRRARGYPIIAHFDDPQSRVEIPVMGLSDSGFESDFNKDSDRQSIKRLATNRLKQEILRERQREIDLRRQGKIYTISEERTGLDANVLEDYYAKQHEDQVDSGSQGSRGTNSRIFVNENKSVGVPPGRSEEQTRHQLRNTSMNSNTELNRVQVPNPGVKNDDVRTEAELRIEVEVREIRQREQELREQRRLANAVSTLTSGGRNNIPANKVPISTYRRT